ncbi:MAG: nitrite/sulfite reductase [Chloroflexi bacterium]|nr:nitrite/sulfite reductase [Chloroflexota bacterium]
MSEAPTWDLVLRRNSIERLKREKAPLAVLNDLPVLITRGYEDVAEDDIVRLQWYGLYHDRPKTGYFMMRVKIPSGLLTPTKLRTLGELSERFGRNEGELTTRQNVQLHWIRLDSLPGIFAALAENGLTTAGGCGDCVRNITGCPVAGIDANELFDCTPIIAETAQYFSGNPEYSDLPRKHKITISTCSYHCNAPAINCISLIGTVQSGVQGFSVRVGGGLSTVPRLARDLDVFVPAPEALPVLRAALDAWRTNLQYRVSRVKARLKFMIDDVGAEGFRAQMEERLGRRLADLTEPVQPVGETAHLGIHAQKQPGLYYIGFPVYLGIVTGTKLKAIADIAGRVGADIRLTRQQNFILGNVPEAAIEQVVREVAAVGFSLSVNRLRGTSVGCTGSPLCNYAVAETKVKLDEIVQHLEAAFGQQAEGITVNVDGCPHSCAHHWTADIGLQGSTLRERGDAGEKLEAYEIYLRGGLGGDATIGRSVVRRVPARDVKHYVERLVGAYLAERQGNERFKDFSERKTDEELIAIASGRTVTEVEAELSAKARPRHRAVVAEVGVS